MISLTNHDSQGSVAVRSWCNLPTHIIDHISHTYHLYHLYHLYISYIYISHITYHIYHTNWYLPWCHEKPSIFSAIFSARRLELGDLPSHQQLEGGLEKPWESREKIMGTYPKMMGKWWEHGKMMGKSHGKIWTSGNLGREKELISLNVKVHVENEYWVFRLQKNRVLVGLSVYHCPHRNCCGTPIHFWGKPVRAMVKAWYMWYGNLIIGDSWSWFYKSLSLDWWSSSSIRKNNPCFDETGGLSFGWLYINTSPLHPIVFR